MCRPSGITYLVLPGWHYTSVWQTVVGRPVCTEIRVLSDSCLTCRALAVSLAARLLAIMV